MHDEPTVIWANGTKIWKNSEGQWHRDGDLPAIIGPTGYYAWYQNDKLHRDGDLPAAIDTVFGTCTWCQDGKYIKMKIYSEEEVEMFKLPYGGK